MRDRWPGERVFTYWDYRAGMFHQDLGMRIDLVLASDTIADRVRAAWVDRQARKGRGPSDHAPVIVDLDEAPDGDIGPVVPPPSAPVVEPGSVELPQSSGRGGRPRDAEHAEESRARVAICAQQHACAGWGGRRLAGTRPSGGAAVNAQLPPGPRLPSPLQTLAWWSRPTAYLERCRARYGRRFTVRLTGQSPFVIVSDPDEVKQIFTAAPEVLHPGEGARILEPVLGANSVILLDEGAHLRQRKLLLPAFHGEKMQDLSGLMSEIAERELAAWPREQEVSLHPRLQRLTLEVILRAVFGVRRGAQLDELRELLTELLAFGESPLSLLPPSSVCCRAAARWRDMERARSRSDELIYALIEERREGDGDGEDVLSLLLGARDEDGESMTPVEMRDELVTALVAGHETTASQLAWAIERIARDATRAAPPARRARRGLRRGVPDGHDQRDPAPPAGRAERRAATGQAAGRDRRRRVRAGGGAVRERLPAASRPSDLPGSLRVPPGALPRGASRHVHVDPVRRRQASLPGGELCAARDEARAAGGAVGLRAARRRRSPETTRRRGITFSPSRGSRVTLLDRTARPARPRASAAGAPALA